MDRRAGGPEVGMKVGMKLPADARAVYTARRPSGVGGTGQMKTQETRILPDKASEGPTGQHQDTGQGQREEASRGLLTCVGSRGGMSPNSN